MENRSFKLFARVSTSNPEAIEPVLQKLISSNKRGSVRKGDTDDEFVVVTEMEGSSGKELNRSLLSELRRVEKKTRLRSEWTSKNTTESFFDYVLKKKEIRK
jgi:hypothetical protein